MGWQMYQRSVLNALTLSILFITGCNGLLNNQDSSNADLLSSPDFIQTTGKIDTIVSQIEDKHSIRVYYKKGPFLSWLKFKYKLASKSDYARLVKYLEVLQKELDKYPEGFLQKAGINAIVVCKDMFACGFAVPWDNTIYCSYTACNNTYSKQILHHEIYHMIEAKFNADCYYEDPVWIAFNDSEFKYGKGTECFDPAQSIQGKNFYPSNGFITDSAKSASWQDKAEVYTGLFVEEISTCLHEWISEDEILRNKVNYMKGFLLHCCDKMTSDFWKKLCTGKCSPLDDDSLYETKDLRFSAVLSDTATIGLIAIAEDSGNLAKWWKPNGEIFDEAPFIIGDPVKTVDDKLKQYRLFLCDKTNRSLWGLSGWELPEGKIYKIETPPFDGNGRVFLDVCVVTCGLDDDKTTCQLKKGVPLGKWTVEATYNPKTKVTSGPDRSIKFGKPYAKKGKLGLVEVSHNISESRKTAKQIVAVDHTGEIHLPMHFETVATEHGQRTYSFFRDLNLAQVKEFHFKSCPYTWVTFENISLRPGQITDVQVKVGNN